MSANNKQMALPEIRPKLVRMRPLFEMVKVGGQVYIPVRGTDGLIQNFLEIRPEISRPMTIDASTQTNEVPLIDLTEEDYEPPKIYEWTSDFDEKLGDASKITETFD